jgi:8-oxo-dGTP pyrophosphatase MutT (NUDIX family)
MIRDHDSGVPGSPGKIVEFPGGKVEASDKSVYDTMGRELWEELFLQGQHEGDYLKNWAEIKQHIITHPNDEKHAAWIYIMNQIVNSSYLYIQRDGSTLKTVYFIVNMDPNIVRFLIESLNHVYLLDMQALQDARDLVYHSPHLSGSSAVWRMIEVPAMKDKSRTFVKIRGRELFCMPKNLTITFGNG